ncbi:MATE family efflux transporter [Mycoplasmoides pirum]|uniref:MATE family efflux transporter n=1 Tax=Mycoplasmoides pirum TaxID=2122 RepID=UPI00069634A4|nr:MATE family efflux transporter [Mycoplasmoides pirum]
MNSTKSNNLSSNEISIDSKQTLNPKVKKILHKDLFENKNVFKLLLRFVLPALLVTFFQAMYIFSDQIMMVKFIPFSSNLNPNGLTLEKLFPEDILVPYLQQAKDNAITPTDLVRSAISISAPITLILTATTLLVSMGVAVSFAKSLAKQNAQEIEEVWSTGFIANAILGLFVSFFILGISPLWLSSSAKGTFASSHDNPIIEKFNLYAQNVQVDLAQGYVYILCGFNIFQIMSQMYYFLAQSEGRQLFISIVPTFCNVLNIILDYILIVFASLALMGSALATAIGWMVNFIAYVEYNLILTKKNQTNLILKNLRFKLYKWKLFNIIILIGVASFLRNASASFSNSMFQTYLVNMTNSSGYAITHDTSPNIFQSYFGSVTPISNLAIQSVWGLIQGGRTVASYKYGKEDYNAIKKIYWYVLLIAIVYGVIIYSLFAFALSDVFLINLFDVQTNNLEYTTYLLRITMLQAVFLALGTTGQLYFQSTQRISFSWFVAILQNIILFIPLLFIFQSASNAIATNNPTLASSETAMNCFIWLLPTCTILASSINIVVSLIHMYTRMGKYENEIKQNLRKPSKLMQR